jgi:hypothetical protein
MRDAVLAVVQDLVDARLLDGIAGLVARSVIALVARTRGAAARPFLACFQDLLSGTVPNGTRSDHL